MGALELNSNLSLFVLVLILLPSILSAALPAASNGSVIVVEWDVLSWTADGYQAQVSFAAKQLPERKAWSYGWSWAKREVIWELAGTKVVDQGNCSRFIGNKPISCKRSPKVIVASSNKTAAGRSIGSFNVTVGIAGTSNTTVDLPKEFTLEPGYACGSVSITAPRIFTNERHHVQALMSWKSTCLS